MEQVNYKIQIKDFHKGFGTKKIHTGVHFEVIQGECLGLIGGSGTGKSVLLRSIIGLEKADRGEIFIDNEDISFLKEIDLIPIRKKVAYAFQGGALFDSMTVFDNLAYPLREHTKLNPAEIQQKVMAMLNNFGLSTAEHLFPSHLSGGMQKRVGLARAMMLDPEVILYDEPTAGLDPFNTHKIQDLILKLKGTGVTSVLVTHDMPTAFAVCDRIAFLFEGRIQAIKTLAELEKDEEGLIQKFLRGDEV